MPNERSVSPGTSRDGTVRRVFGPTFTICTTGASFSRRYVKVTSAGDAFGLITSRNVSKKPCEPSAKNQSVDGCSTADPVCPA